MRKLLLLTSLLVMLAPPVMADEIRTNQYGMQEIVHTGCFSGARSVPATTEEEIEAVNKQLASLGFKIERDGDGKLHLAEVAVKSRFERFCEYWVDVANAHPKVVTFTKGAAHAGLFLLNVGGAVGNIIRYTL
jgi:hypothetical protein